MTGAHGKILMFRTENSFQVYDGIAINKNVTNNGREV